MYIVGIVGGPCSGKTKCLPLVYDRLKEMGYIPFIIQETATEVAYSGIKPNTVVSMQMFQRIILQMQLQKENLFISELQNEIPNEKIIILCDRTALDGLLYLYDDLFEEEAEKCGSSIAELFDRYDCIIHLSTVALTNPEKYANKDDTGNVNKARRENLEEAIAVDKKSRGLFSQHYNFHIIESKEKVSEKVDEIIEIIEKEVNI